jgi:hypothetical protein
MPLVYFNSDVFPMPGAPIKQGGSGDPPFFMSSAQLRISMISRFRPNIRSAGRADLAAKGF